MLHIWQKTSSFQFSRINAPRLSVMSRSPSYFDYWFVCLSFQKSCAWSRHKRLEITTLLSWTCALVNFSRSLVLGLIAKYWSCPSHIYCKTSAEGRRWKGHPILNACFLKGVKHNTYFRNHF